MDSAELTETDPQGLDEPSVESMLPQEQISPSEVRQIRLDHLEKQLDHILAVAGEAVPVAKQQISLLVQRAQDGDEKAMVELNKGPLRTLMLLIAQETKLMKDWEKSKIDPLLTPAEKTRLAHLQKGMGPDMVTDVLARLEDGELGNPQALALYKEIMVAKGNEGDIEPVGQFGAVKIAQKLETVQKAAQLKPPDEGIKPFPSVKAMLREEDLDNDS